MDISNILSNTGVALEAQAFETFGAAINNQTQGALNGIFGPNRADSSIFNIPSSDNRVVAFDEVRTSYQGIYDTTNYAQAMASGRGGFDPKSGFLFKVSFEFNNDVAEMAASFSPDIQGIVQRNLTFLVKSIEMPRFKFDYAEFNYYNFRTKMLRRVEHEELSFKMYDDVANNGLHFINAYLQLIAPVHRRGWDAGANLEDNGFNFSPNDFSNSAQRDVLGSGGMQKNILRKMTVEHFYLYRGDGMSPAQEAIKLNTFEFVNPRLTAFQLPDLSYDAGGEPQEISCTIDFDALHMIVGKQNGIDAVDQNATGFMEMNDILATSGTGLTSRGYGPRNIGGGANATSPFVDIIANQGGRLVQSAVTNALYRSGMGGIAGGALANTISTIGGTLGTNAARTLALGGRSIAAGISIPNTPQVIDSAIGGQYLGQSISDYGLGGD